VAVYNWAGKPGIDSLLQCIVNISVLWSVVRACSCFSGPPF